MSQVPSGNPVFGVGGTSGLVSRNRQSLQSAGAFVTSPVDPRRRQIENFGFLSGGGLSNFTPRPEGEGNINALIQAFVGAGLPIPFAGTSGIPAVNFRMGQFGGNAPQVPPTGGGTPAPSVGGPATTAAVARLNAPAPQSGQNRATP